MRQSEVMDTKNIIESLHSLFEDVGEHPTDTKKLYNHLAKVCSELVHAEACSIFISNERGRLMMRGDHGHDFSFVDSDKDEDSYTPGEGVTGVVFQTGKPSSVSSKEEVVSYPGHKNKLYPRQWKDGVDHICHSWYQFPLGKSKPPLGVMKIENKLGSNEKPLENGGFNESEKQILEIVANSIVPLIILKKTKEDMDRIIQALHSIGVTTNIDDIYSPVLLDKIAEQT